MILDADRTKILIPQRKREWDQPSAHGYGIPNQTRFRLTARLNDGAIFWRGWFDDRDDADEFLWALFRGNLQWSPELWKLPNPQWHPDFHPGLTYDFATVAFLTSPTNALATWPRPTDWNNSNNTMECVGGGGNGYSGQGVALAGGGGGGGGYSKVSNRTLTGSNNGYWIGQYAQASYFGITGTDYAGSLTYAAGGSNSVQVYYGGAGGLATNCKGDLVNSGGAAQNTYYGSSGGGGAGGPNGAGAPSGPSVGDYASSGSGGGGSNGGFTGGAGAQGAVGGSGGNNRFGTGGGPGGTGIAVPGSNGGGGAGGCGYGYGQAACHAGPGGSGTEWDASHGCGGGSGGGGDGGNGTGIVGGYGYGGGSFGGGGGGGGAGTYSGSAGQGAQGIAVVIYTPQSKVSAFNMPMGGM